MEVLKQISPSTHRGEVLPKAVPVKITWANVELKGEDEHNLVLNWPDYPAGFLGDMHGGKRFGFVCEWE